jgi:hypothetical protein
MNNTFDWSRFPALKSSGAFTSQVMDNFARFIQSASDDTLYRMSPLRAAPQLGISERESVDLFLHATSAICSTPKAFPLRADWT